MSLVCVLSVCRRRCPSPSSSWRTTFRSVTNRLRLCLPSRHCSSTISHQPSHRGACLCSYGWFLFFIPPTFTALRSGVVASGMSSAAVQKVFGKKDMAAMATLTQARCVESSLILLHLLPLVSPCNARPFAWRMLCRRLFLRTAGLACPLITMGWRLGS